RRTGSDGRRAGERRQAILHPRVPDGDVDHRLLVAGLVVLERLRILREGLTDPGDVPVAEDAPAAGEEALLDAGALDVLLRGEWRERVGYREPLHPRTIFAAASTAPRTSPSGGYSSVRPATRPRT